MLSDSENKDFASGQQDTTISQHPLDWNFRKIPPLAKLPGTLVTGGKINRPLYHRLLNHPKTKRY